MYRLFQARLTAISVHSRTLSWLSHRSILELRGQDSSLFLQGLTTVDVINPTRVSQYSALLNVQGRLLYDIIIYHMGQGRLWVESDKTASEQIINHFKRYVLRAKVELEQLTDVCVCSQLPNDANTSEDHIIKITDPRTSDLGDRVLVKKDISLQEDQRIDNYHEYRLQCGIPEGIHEMPPGQCLPLEMNLDYMNGVSFNKGCYLGQELTSRTHHTGVVRKRVVPLLLETKLSHFNWGMSVVNDNSKTVGKVLGCHGNHAIGLLRLPNIVEGEKLTVVTDDKDTILANWNRPQWWPS